ncbi:MAG: folylpolyglutamate synthase/dihydrofolate synthase family protein [Anaerovoracaceae bacterium]|jgi:dihydrofolate synthase/folylpolyglutamate synthase|nr:folylpolyglutamate synthase/dihydrofolate synthase family protein [Anaerovoracaceae bacterium]
MKPTPIDRISQYLRFGSRLGLERMEKLLAMLDNPEEKLPVIHVAGTNGKGSVCRYIYEVLLANGYRTGLYISPFLQVFNERMEVDGNQITDSELDKYTDLVLSKVEAMVKNGEESPTEFEIVTAIAFCYFKDKECDFVILEVGLGGSGDSTNVITKPLLSIITSISYDHMDRLGNTLEEIAGEKAGIIKAGVPVIVNVEDGSAAKIIARKAYETGAPLYDVTRFDFKNISRDLNGQSFDTQIYGTDYRQVFIKMLGLHQIHNAMTALTALEILRGEKKISVSKEAFYQGMAKAMQPGRFEVFGAKPFIILDGAHNQGGAESLLETVGEFFLDSRILMVVGILADKDVDAMIESFSQITDEFIATEPLSPRALSARDIEARLVEINKSVVAIPDMEEAYNYAVKKAKNESWDVLIFGGSLYLVGKIREMICNER